MLNSDLDNVLSEDTSNNRDLNISRDTDNSSNDDESVQLPLQEESRVLIQRQNVFAFQNELPNECDLEAIKALKLYSLEGSDWQAPVNPESEMVIYSDPDRGLEMSIPFNSEWGADQYQLNPYDFDGERILFGNIFEAGAGCGSWVSGSQSLKFLDAKTLKETLADLELESNAMGFKYSIRTFKVGDKDVVEYIKDGVCAGGGTIIIGRKFNYELSKTCSANSRLDIIELMQFVN